MDSLDINHWLCDPVMQSPLIPTYDKCTLEWREVYRGVGGGWLKEKYEAAGRGAIHCVSKEISNQQAKRTYCGSEYSEDTNPGTEDTRKQAR